MNKLKNPAAWPGDSPRNADAATANRGVRQDQKVAAVQQVFHLHRSQSSGFRPGYGQQFLDRHTAAAVLDVVLRAPAVPSPSDVSATLSELRRRVRSDRLDLAIDTLKGALRC